MARNIVLWVIIALVMMIVFQSFSPQRTSNTSISYSDFVSAVKSGRVSTVKIDGSQIEFKCMMVQECLLSVLKLIMAL